MEVAAEQVKALNAYCTANGTQFVDPDFPPIDKSLYKSDLWAKNWQCSTCQTMNELPPPVSKELALMPGLAALRKPLSCKACHEEAPRVQAQARPSQWLRPRDIRDDVTMQMGGTPWTLFREQPRSDDVRQGALGNCWFVAALSIVAENPDLIRRMFIGSQEYNANGAYQLRLCRDGEWHTVLVDDVFPCTNLDMLAYAKAARRQLWVPLVEKAAAKLFGCYQHLSSGTVAEALVQFTGFPADQFPLLGEGMPPSEEQRKPQAEMTPEEIAAAMVAKEAEVEELWQTLLDAKERGFIMGTSCVGRKDMKQKEMGLQAPHGYAVLDLRDIMGFRLVKLRNPWGIESWNGDWGPHSDKWREYPDLKRELRPEREDDGVFWFRWEDWREYFATVEICRTRDGAWSEVRQRGWLPSAVGMGTAVEFTCLTDTEVDISLHQEGHIVRGESGGNHMVDLGFALLRIAEREGETTYELVDDTLRKMQPCASKAFKLGEGTYYLIPITFNQFAVPAPRKYMLSTHSSQPLLIEQRDCDPRWMAEVMIQRTIKRGKRNEIVPPEKGGPVAVYTHHSEGEGGMVVAIENHHPMLCTSVTVDCSESPGVVSTRGVLFCQDSIPPGHRALLFVLSPKEGVNQYGWSMQQSYDVSQGVENHIPPLDDGQPCDIIHKAYPIPTSERQGGGFSDPRELLRNAMAGMQPPGGSMPGQGQRLGGPSSPGMGPADMDDDVDMEEEMLQAAIRASLAEGVGEQPPQEGGDGPKQP